jgi:hypothetical protein
VKLTTEEMMERAYAEAALRYPVEMATRSERDRVRLLLRVLREIFPQEVQSQVMSEELAHDLLLSEKSKMIDLSELSERERWEYLFAMFGEGKGPRAGRPRKNSDIPKWRDFGLTRKRVWLMRHLAEIPEAEFEAYMAEPHPPSHRAILVHFGKINVPDENVFDGTPLGELAQKLLAPCERLLDSGALSERERRIIKRAVLARLQQIFRKPADAVGNGR